MDDGYDRTQHGYSDTTFLKNVRYRHDKNTFIKIYILNIYINVIEEGNYTPEGEFDAFYSKFIESKVLKICI